MVDVYKKTSNARFSLSAPRAVAIGPKSLFSAAVVDPWEKIEKNSNIISYLMALLLALTKLPE